MVMFPGLVRHSQSFIDKSSPHLQLSFGITLALYCPNNLSSLNSFSLMFI
jgi:hypothetical protein